MGLPDKPAVRTVPGKLMLKGGVPLFRKDGEKKREKKRKKRKTALLADDEPAAPAGGIGGEVGKAPTSSYEELFPAEMARAAEAKGRTQAWYAFGPLSPRCALAHRRLRQGNKLQSCA
jgi:hypothetical protein